MDEYYVAGHLFAHLAKHPRDTEKTSRMNVVTAGMHHARHCRPVGDVLLVLDRQRVEVGAQGDHLAGLASPQRRNDTAATYARPDFQAQLAMERGDLLRGSLLLEGEFRVHVEVAAKGDE